MVEFEIESTRSAVDATPARHHSFSAASTSDGKMTDNERNEPFVDIDALAQPWRAPLHLLPFFYRDPAELIV
jgi:hypothetical protein